MLLKIQRKNINDDLNHCSINEKISFVFCRNFKCRHKLLYLKSEHLGNWKKKITEATGTPTMC